MALDNDLEKLAIPALILFFIFMSGGGGVSGVPDDSSAIGMGYYGTVGEDYGDFETEYPGHTRSRGISQLPGTPPRNRTESSNRKSW